jgi:putative solute:sodium symporter small subunit
MSFFNPTAFDPLRPKRRRLQIALIFVWALASFGPGFFAHHLSYEVWGWPLHFWLAAQGAIWVFLALVVFYAWQMNRMEAAIESTNSVLLPDVAPKNP